MPARVPAFLYRTGFREKSLQHVITKLESCLFGTVTGHESHAGLTHYGLYDTAVAQETYEERARLDDATVATT